MKKQRCYIAAGRAVRCGGPIRIVDAFADGKIARVHCDGCGEEWDTSASRANDYVTGES